MIKKECDKVLITRKMILASAGVGDGFTENTSYPGSGFIGLHDFYINYDMMHYLPFELEGDTGPNFNYRSRQ